MFNIGDIVVGLKTASNKYSITTEGTFWAVYDVNKDSGEVLLGRQSTKEVYLENQQEYNRFKKLYEERKITLIPRMCVTFKNHWVESHRFKLIDNYTISHNEDGLKFLNQDENYTHPMEVFKK